MKEENIELSVVIPVRNSEKVLIKLYFYLGEILEGLKRKYEIIFVDDGSTDNSFNILKAFNQKDKTVRIIKLSKNFGQHAALSAGMKNIMGEILIIMDDDLQNDPSDIPKLLKKIDQGYDIVFSWRKVRRDPVFKRRLPSYICNILISLLLGMRVHDLGCSLKAFKGEVVKEVNRFGSLLAFSSQLCNYKTIEVEVEGFSSQLPQSRYNTVDLFKLALKIFMSCLSNNRGILNRKFLKQEYKIKEIVR